MAAAAACSERRAGAGQRLKVCGAPCVAGARGRPARRAVRANIQAARPGLRVLASASRRPARPQRPRHASRVAADSPFALPFTVFGVRSGHSSHASVILPRPAVALATAAALLMLRSMPMCGT